MAVLDWLQVQQDFWPQVLQDFRRRKVDTLREFLNRRGLGEHLTELDELFGSKVDTATCRERLQEAFQAASTQPLGGLAMAFYVHGLCLEKWEGSTNWHTIELVLQEALRAGQETTKTLQERNSPEAMKLILEHAQCVIDSMRVESALNCSCPIFLHDEATEVVHRALATLDRVSVFEADLEQARAYLEAVARTDLDYFSSLLNVADAVRAFVEKGAAATPELEETISKIDLIAGNEDLHADVYGSELRAHRRTLQALVSKAAAPRLHVDRAKVIYCYPFALPKRTPQEVIDSARRNAITWQLGGVVPTDVRELSVSDMWESADPQGRRYEGITVSLSPITVETTDPDPNRRLIEAEAEIRLSQLGNHYLRIELELEDAHPHYVNQALRRPSGSMGEEAVHSGDSGTSWSRVSDYADAVVSAVEHELARPSAEDEGGPAPFPDDHKADRVFHVVLSIRGLSIRHADGRTEPADGTALLDNRYVGSSLLRQPVRQSAATLEEWIRYPSGNAENLLADRGFTGDVVIRTANTTVIAMPTTPSFLVDTYEEGAEFVASLPTLLRQWTSEVSRFVGDAAKELDEFRKQLGENDQMLQPPELEQQQLELRDLIVGVRSELALLKSPLLCKTIVNREFLDRLSEAAGLPRYEADLDAHIAEADSLYERTTTVVAVLEQRRQQRVRRNLDLILAVIAAASLADMFALFNGIADNLPRWVILLEASVVVFVGAIIVRYFLRTVTREGRHASLRSLLGRPGRFLARSLARLRP
jgi:hypothetical protein